MPENGPQFDYPETGWSTGKMRMARTTRGLDPGKEYRELEGVRREKESKASENRAYPTLPQEDLDAWFKGPPERDRLHYKKDNKLDNAIEDHPDGFIVDRDHPGLDALRDSLELFNMPGETEGEGGPLFARPKRDKPTLTSQGPGPTQWETA